MDDEVAEARDAAAHIADTAASAGDVAAMERDFEADIEMTRGPMTTDSVRAQRDREAAGRDRARAVDDRGRARQDRKTAKQGRDRACADREAAREAVAALRALDQAHVGNPADTGQKPDETRHEDGHPGEALIALAVRAARDHKASKYAALRIVTDAPD